MKDSILSICNKQKFDFVGNIHDYFGQLIELPGELGYDVNPSTYNIITAPKQRILVFLGDFTDGVDDPISVLRLVMQAIRAKQAVCLRGNHVDKLYKALIGKIVTIPEDLQKTLHAICDEGDGFKDETIKFLESLPYQLVIHSYKVIATHGGLKEK